MITEALVYESHYGGSAAGMKFNPRARIDQGQYRDGGGSGGRSGAGMRLPIPTGRGGKLSVGSVVLAVVVYLVTQYVGTGSSGGGDDTVCQTGADANTSDKCASALLATSVQDFWEGAFPEQVKGSPAYEPAEIVVFSGSTSSGCGQAGAEMGPFYCPTDRTVYIDSRFTDDMLEGQLGAEGGPFALGYVVAHEYGHHVENLLGLLDQERDGTGPRSTAVKIELMADCLGGMWARSAEQTQDADGNTIIEDLTRADIAAAVDAATAVGDDRIQKRSGGGVNEESWTHGSSAQRVAWFTKGYEQGSLAACNTFRAGAL